MTNGNYDIEKKEFARKLDRIMKEKGISQSDVARLLFGAEVDNRGRNVASQRDLVSKWCRGVAIPGPKNLHILAKYLDVDKEWLAPGHGIPQAEKRLPDFAMEMQGDLVKLNVNATVGPGQARRIFAILREKEKS